MQKPTPKPPPPPPNETTTKGPPPPTGEHSHPGPVELCPICRGYTSRKKPPPPELPAGELPETSPEPGPAARHRGPPMLCPYCSARAISNGAPRAHAHHTARKRYYKCPDCGAHFATAR